MTKTAGTNPTSEHSPSIARSVRCALTNNGQYRLYISGQEEPVLRALQFFDKDPIGFRSSNARSL